MDKNLLLAVAILLPALCAALCYTIRKAALRNTAVALSALGLFVVAGGFIRLLMTGGTIEISLEGFPFELGWIIKFLDLALMAYFIYLGFKGKRPLVVLLAVAQLVPMVLFEIFGNIEEPAKAFVIDPLALVMLLLVSIIGPIITIFAMGYMKEHEHHLALKVSKQPRFFAVLLLFLAAMNALVMTDNLLWMSFFWEITTLCSYLLISHDGTEEAVKNGFRALWINLVGGVAFTVAIVIIYQGTHTLSVQQLISLGTTGGITGLVPLGLGLLCFAGFTKSAQFPFQSWLLGAMVAPTPVSALLHSSTMVKAGVYLVVRLSPAFAGTLLGKVVAVVGGFTFLAASAIAISQRNGKRVLAYSTIANLGLIICCAGIGTHIALGGAVLLMIFHAVSKGLLFLCIGTIENGIGSRDIEDMQGLLKKMPFTTVITVIGMISMLLPPFGVLLTKWLAIEAAVNQPLVLILLVLGSAFTVVFWAKWIGIILTMSYKSKYTLEKLPITVRGSLALLLAGVLGASIGVGPLYNTFVTPYLDTLKLPDNLVLKGGTGGLWMAGKGGLVGGFASIPLFMIVFAILITVPYFLYKTRPERVKPPYMCGEQASDDVRGLEFTGPADKAEQVIVHNYYLSGAFGEANLTRWVNLVGGAVILVMFGVVI